MIVRGTGDRKTWLLKAHPLAETHRSLMAVQRVTPYALEHLVSCKGGSKSPRAPVFLSYPVEIQALRKGILNCVFFLGANACRANEGICVWVCNAGQRRGGRGRTQEERSLESDLGVSRILGVHINLWGRMS